MEERIFIKFNKNILLVSIKRKIIIILLLVVPSLHAKDLNTNFKLPEYVGTESGIQYIAFKKNYGDNLFAKKIPKMNFFLGIRINYFLSFEFGYDYTLNVSKFSIVAPPTKYLGEAKFGLNIGESAKCLTNIKITSWHGGFFYKYPIRLGNKYNDVDDNFSILNYFGLKKTKIKLKSFIYMMSFIPTSIEDDLNYKNNKILFKIATGIKYIMPCKKFSFRGLVSFENMSRLQPLTRRCTLQAKLQNSFGVHLSLLFEPIN